MSILETSRHDGVLTLALNRPEIGNALGADLVEALIGAASAAIADEEPGLSTPAPVSGRPHGRSRVSQGREMQLDSQLPVAPGALISGVQQVSPSSQAPKVPLARLR